MLGEVRELHQQGLVDLVRGGRESPVLDKQVLHAVLSCSLERREGSEAIHSFVLRERSIPALLTFRSCFEDSRVVSSQL